ncbi:hypothetical protein CKO_00618 [Citrobacter koseri ATCC BAA-895]|uniref:Uncharacterized protein n=1 Tax=Citrobacter koseri (strain ATCC BAA-895 / CDC 4225-83 / SGSC4696) TaxID=290338 RepID=A8AE59_CITK8|nr:hypothetical protein CKO_00618 [Citrobacter koseri ATCC BAA-895]
MIFPSCQETRRESQVLISRATALCPCVFIRRGVDIPSLFHRPVQRC